LCDVPVIAQPQAACGERLPRHTLASVRDIANENAHDGVPPEAVHRFVLHVPDMQPRCLREDAQEQDVIAPASFLYVGAQVVE
jgi:hypothetical protein